MSKPSADEIAAYLAGNKNYLACFECGRRDATVQHSNVKYVPLCPDHRPREEPNGE